MIWYMLGLAIATGFMGLFGYLISRDTDTKRVEEILMGRNSMRVKVSHSENDRSSWPESKTPDPSWTMDQLRYLRNFERDTQRQVQETFNLKLHNLSKRLHLDPHWFDHLSDNSECGCIFSYISEAAHVYCDEWLTWLGGKDEQE